ncbi:MAG TPA: fatty acid oxidation complex subunit alpha FadJ [Gemmatimonadaceae bacterium]|nr:fatty acid oxidation complex subunit alpha FadJ [Gemmatimonadaceae bacterium]
MSSPYALNTEIQDSVAVITFDLQNEPVNKLNRAVKDEFVALFDRLERDLNVRAAVLLSGKKDSFIAGADIDEFLELQTAADAERMSHDGQLLLDSVERMRTPLVCAIHGACLGGAVELALASAYRIATDHPKTILALPEVQLGLIPGAGGTQRLPRLIGMRAALDMILTGKNIRAKKAYQTGLVDELVHPSILRDIAIRRARDIADGTRKHERHRTGVTGFLLEENPAGRRVVLKKAREETLKKTHGHYPAPLAAIDAVAAGYSGGASHGYREESRLFGEMAATPVSKQLIYLFYATTALKKDSGVSTDEGEPPPVVTPINKLGILGAGFMGSGIASVAVQQAIPVRMRDADHGRVAKGYAAVRDILKERLTRKQITRMQFTDMMSLLGGTIDYTGFGSADLIIEAVFEDLDVKHEVLREIEAVMKSGAIFASNTSTIPIAQIATASSAPGRVLGMHFFSPVHKMPLLEVIVTPQTNRDVIATAVAFGKTIGKTVIVVSDGPGFYVNRILTPYINEAGRLLDQGASIDAIDKALVNFGFPVGPVTLVDEVGLDVASKAGKIMHDAFGERFSPAQSVQAVVASGRFGRKSKKGFYLYDDEGKKGDVDESVYQLVTQSARETPPSAATEPKARPEFPADEIVQRTVLPMLNEAVRCLEEGVIRSPRDGDVGAVYGFGFPPFRGGPFRYIDTLGADEVVRQLEELNDRFPGRYAPAETLLAMARRKDYRFHPER